MLRSLTGVWPVNYPAENNFSLAPSALEPWWGAWHPVIYVGILLLVTTALMLTWTLLALLYMLPVRLIAYYADRELTLAGAWRVASAALMPGAFCMMLGILLYGWQIVDLIQLGFFVALHLVVGWVYLFVSPCRIKTIVTDTFRSNPFGNQTK